MNANRLGIFVAPLATGLLVVACATSAIQQPSHASAGTDYDLIVQANDAQSRFDLTIISKTPRPICFSVEDWPNDLGQSAGGAGRALLHTGNGDLAASDTNFGYCVGAACELTVPPKQSLKGHINYREFGDPARIMADAGKRLEYQIKPYFCSAHP